MSCPLGLSCKISAMLLQERGNRGAGEGETSPEGSVTKDSSSEGKEDEKPVQPKTPVLRKV